MKVKKNVVEKSWRILTKRGMMYLVYAESAQAAVKKVQGIINPQQNEIIEVIDNGTGERSDEE